MRMRKPGMLADRLVQIVDGALADAAQRSGDWLVCKPGCSQCCAGVFSISGLDAGRLRDGLAAAEEGVAGRVRGRVAATIARLESWFPGDACTGVLAEDEERVELFEEFAADEVCPVLDPVTGTCDLYAARPVLCRTFGPPIKNDEGGLAICELCFDGATENETAACEMDSSWRVMEGAMESAYEEEHPASGRTIVAWALRNE